MILSLIALFNICVSTGIPTPEYYDYTANYVYHDDPAFKLTAVCSGEGTNMVKCTWVPLLQELRTPEERTLAGGDY